MKDETTDCDTWPPYSVDELEKYNEEILELLELTMARIEHPSPVIEAVYKFLKETLQDP